jgi:hypothetical protein
MWEESKKCLAQEDYIIHLTNLIAKKKALDPGRFQKPQDDSHV